MKFPISSHIEAVRYPPISEVKGWIAGRVFPADRPLIDLCQAVPDYPPPAELMDFLAGALTDPSIGRYTDDEGLPEVREVVADWYARRYGAGPNASEICLTIGASQAFWLAAVVLCRAGDEVILPSPAYFDHPMALQALGIVCRFLPFDPASGGLPDPDAVARLITPRTRAILLVTPSNPTGATASPKLLQNLYALARKRRIALVLDETYNAFTGEEAPHQLFVDPCWGDHLVHLGSFGKTFALTGFRAGVLAASERFIHHALKVQDTMAVCQPRITQVAVRFGCENLDAWMRGKRETMRRRHNGFRTEFLRGGNPYQLIASGAFFAWIRHPFDNKSSRQVARYLAEEKNLLCLPGEVFGPGLQSYLRLSFGNIREEEIPRAVQLFRESPDLIAIME